MASESLLEKEKKYYAINSELERETAELLKKADMVLKSEKISNPQNAEKNKENLQSRGTFVKSSAANYENCKDNVDIPEPLNNMSAKAIYRYFKTKIQTMQNEHNKVVREYRKQFTDAKDLEKENKRLAEDKEKWFQLCNAHKITITKLENQIFTLNSKYQTKENEITTLKKENEHLKKELKSVNLNLCSAETKTTKAVEELENTKSALKIAKQEEKNTSDAYRKKINDLTVSIKQIEKQNKELKQGFKRQLQLIDNLKMQKVYLEASKANEAVNDEYLKILDKDFTL